MNFKLLRPILIAAFLVLATQVTRFENRVVVSANGETVTGGIEDSQISAWFSNLGGLSISVQTQNSMSSSGVVSYAELQDESGRVLSTYSRPVLFLFGRNFFGKRSPSSVVPTFGDWTMDRYDANPVNLGMTIPDKFKLLVDFVGRGDQIVRIGDDITVNVRDGFIDNDISICSKGKCPSVTTRHEDVSLNFVRLLNPLLESILVAYLLLFFVRGASKCLQQSAQHEFSTSFPLLWIAALSVIHFVISLLWQTEILGAIPHIPDSATYYRQSILLAQGKLSTPLPLSEQYESLLPNAAYVKDGMLSFRHATHFWPALLSVFVWLGFPAVLNPILNMSALFLSALIAYEIFGARIALLTALLFAFSPFTLLMSGDFLTHSGTQVFILTSIYLLLRYRKSSSLVSAAIAGSTAAYALGMRPVTTLCVLFPLGIYAFIQAEKKLRMAAMFFVGALPVFLLLLADQKILTGSYFESPYSNFHGESIGMHNLTYGANWVDSMLGFLPPLLWHAPPFLLMVMPGLAIVPLLFEKRREDLVLLFSFLFLVFGHLVVNVHGIHGYGPRFLYEGTFALSILCARGITILLDEASVMVRRGLAAAFVLLLAFDIYGLWTILPRYRNYNGISTSLFAEISALPLDNSVVLVTDQNWQGMEIASTLFDPEFKKSIFVKEDSEGNHRAILSKYPNREVWRVVGEHVEKLPPSE